MPGINATITKFGYPATCLAEYAWWVVLLRPKQITFGTLVLASKSDADSLGALEPEAYAEMAHVTRDLQAALKSVVANDKINYICLMMVDPQVHFHVIPRHHTPRDFAGRRFADAFWPRPPDVTQALDVDEQTFVALQSALKNAWVKA